MTPVQDYGSYGTGAAIAAAQSGLIGITGGGTNVKLTGCELTLTKGLWLVTGQFFSGRIWQTGTGYASAVLRSYLTAAGGAALTGSPITPYPYCNQFVNVENEQRASAPPVTLQTTVEVTAATYGVELWGGCDMVVGTNFASGWRWDSGSENPSVISAVKLR